MNHTKQLIFAQLLVMSGSKFSICMIFKKDISLFRINPYTFFRFQIENNFKCMHCVPGMNGMSAFFNRPPTRNICSLWSQSIVVDNTRVLFWLCFFLFSFLTFIFLFAVFRIYNNYQYWCLVSILCNFWFFKESSHKEPIS